MATVDENGLIILRVMLELGITLERARPVSEIARLTPLEWADFDQADTLLLQTGYIEGTGGGAKGRRWLTPSGIEYVRYAMTTRLPLTLDAERILRHVVTSPRKGLGFERSDVMSALDLNSERYEAACRKLQDLGLISHATGAFGDRPFEHIVPTQEGAQSVHYDFRLPQAPSTQIQIGAVFQGSVTGSNIQAFATAFNSQIEQVVSQGDPAALRQEVVEVLDGLVGDAIDNLTIEQKAAYTRAATELKRETAKPDPDPSAIHRLLTILGFAGDLDGTLELGEKSLKLAVKVGPYIALLYQAIVRLLDLPK